LERESQREKEEEEDASYIIWRDLSIFECFSSISMYKMGFFHSYPIIPLLAKVSEKEKYNSN
jgi:hypothetical protein